jgi:hypothetical protein
MQENFLRLKMVRCMQPQSKWLGEQFLKDCLNSSTSPFPSTCTMHLPIAFDEVTRIPAQTMQGLPPK